MATAGDINVPVPADGGAAPQTAPPTVPPFGGNDVVGQLNTWATTIEAKIDQLALGLSEANGCALILQQHVEAKNAEISED